jgi:hypothetical protein
MADDESKRYDTFIDIVMVTGRDFCGALLLLVLTLSMAFRKGVATLVQRQLAA